MFLYKGGFSPKFLASMLRFVSFAHLNLQSMLLKIVE